MSTFMYFYINIWSEILNELSSYILIPLSIFAFLSVLYLIKRLTSV